VPVREPTEEEFRMGAAADEEAYARAGGVDQYRLAVFGNPQRTGAVESENQALKELTTQQAAMIAQLRTQLEQLSGDDDGPVQVPLFMEPGCLDGLCKQRLREKVIAVTHKQVIESAEHFRVCKAYEMKLSILEGNAGHAARHLREQDRELEIARARIEALEAQLVVSNVA
jgi:hypothetical protein